MMHHGITEDMVDRLFGEFFCFSLGGWLLYGNSELLTAIVDEEYTIPKTLVK